MVNYMAKNFFFISERIFVWVAKQLGKPKPWLGPCAILTKKMANLHLDQSEPYFAPQNIMAATKVCQPSGRTIKGNLRRFSSAT